jgi:tetratricopeptide (TPR) repeat protein
MNRLTGRFMQRIRKTPSRYTRRVPRPLLIVIACLLLAGGAAAHEGVHAEIAALDARLKAHPGDVDLLLQRAALYRREGHLSSSIADLAAVARLSPARRELFLERGLTLAAKGESSAAEADLTRFLDAGPPTAAALTGRAKIREAQKRFARARADYDAAIRLRADPELYLARGRMDEAEGRLDRAASGYEEGLRALGGAVAIRLALIRVESARGQHDRAIAQIDEVLASAPLKAEWLLRRADVHAAVGRSKDAERDRLEALRELDATIARRATDLARLTRAKAYLSLSRNAEAMRELEGVALRSPRLSEAQTLLTEARRREASRKGSP